jgi:two-component system phosphate regulon response regulator OmpR
MAERVLMIDDDVALAGMVAEYLQARGMRVTTVGTLAAGCARLRKESWDALILDLMLPDGDGTDFCRELRSQDNALATLPVLMLTARGDEVDRIVGLELGADDYLPKPFNPRELAARLRAILRRSGTVDTHDERTVLRFGRLVIDRGARQVLVDGKLRPLTSHQFELLWVLVTHPGRVLSREAIMDLLRGKSLEAFDRSIDVHISRLRAAIEDDPKDPRRILTVRGAGYVFAQKQDAA